MNRTDLLLAFNEVDDDILLQIEEESVRTIPFRRRLVLILVAALLLLLLMGGVLLSKKADFLGDNLQSYFAYKWHTLTDSNITQEHADLLRSHTTELGLSQTVNGVTVTVESVYADDLHIYAFLRISGVEALEEPWYGFEKCVYDAIFDNDDKQYSIWFSRGNRYLRIDSNGDILLLAFLELSLDDNSIQRERPCEVTLEMTNLMQEPVGKNPVMMAQGTWSFQFTVQLKCEKRIVLPNAEVDGYIHEENVPVDELPVIPATIYDIEIAGSGVSYHYMREVYIGQDIYLIMKDGNEIKAGGGGIRKKLDGNYFQSHEWPIPVNLDEAVAVKIGNTYIPLP